jgi:2-iminobutanoate/2-iminopropanoate deaminase
MGEIIHTTSAPVPVGPYSQAIKHEGIIYLSGQIGIDPIVDRLVPGGIEAETNQIIENIEHILQIAGSSIQKVLKTTCFLTNMDDFEEFNETYMDYFANIKPARSTVEVSKLPLGACVEIEVIAFVE